MKVNASTDNNAVQNMLGFTCMAEVLKNSVGNSQTFELILQSFLSSMKDDTGNIDFTKFDFQNTLTDLGYSEGQELCTDNNLNGLNSLTNTNLSGKSYFPDINSKNPEVRASILSAVEKASKNYGIDKNLILAVIQQESSFDPYSVSWAGAKGLMQLMPENCQELGVSNAFDINQNIDGGTRHLKDMLNRYGNNRNLALAAYNVGSGTLKKRGVTNESQIYKLPAETRDYVKKIAKYYGK